MSAAKRQKVTSSDASEDIPQFPLDTLGLAAQHNHMLREELNRYRIELAKSRDSFEWAVHQSELASAQRDAVLCAWHQLNDELSLISGVSQLKCTEAPDPDDVPITTIHTTPLSIFRAIEVEEVDEGDRGSILEFSEDDDEGLVGGGAEEIRLTDVVRWSSSLAREVLEKVLVNAEPTTWDAATREMEYFVDRHRKLVRDSRRWRSEARNSRIQIRRWKRNSESNEIQINSLKKKIAMVSFHQQIEAVPPPAVETSQPAERAESPRIIESLESQVATLRMKKSKLAAQLRATARLASPDPTSKMSNEELRSEVWEVRRMLSELLATRATDADNDEQSPRISSLQKDLQLLTAELTETRIHRDRVVDESNELNKQLREVKDELEAKEILLRQGIDQRSKRVEDVAAWKSLLGQRGLANADAELRRRLELSQKEVDEVSHEFELSHNEISRLKSILEAKSQEIVCHLEEKLRLTEVQREHSHTQELLQKKVLALTQKLNAKSEALKSHDEARAATVARLMEAEAIAQMTSRQLSEIQDSIDLVPSQQSEIQTLRIQVEELSHSLECEAVRAVLFERKTKEAQTEMEELASHVEVISAGIDSTQVRGLQLENKSLKDRLKCPLCTGNLRDSYLQKCGHVFCKECLGRSLNSRNRKCPQCKLTFQPSEIRPLYLN